MDDSQKWLEAAAGIEQDLEYLKSALSPEDLKQLRVALALYRQNAAADVPWPSPDDLYCIRPLPAGRQQRITVETRPRLAV